MDKPKLTPIDFHNLPYSKKLDTVCKLYVALCTMDDLYTSKGLSKSYYALRRHFTKEQPMVLQSFYDWLYTLESKESIDLTTAYQRVEKHKINIRMQVNKPQKTVAPYKSLLECLGDL